jgi:general secretion pathway protein H
LTRRARQSGFTLLEITIVLVLGLSVMALLVSFSPKGASSADLKAAARALASGLRQAQSTAMASRREATLVVDMDAREFNFTGAPRTMSLPPSLELKLYTAQSEVESERKGGIRFYPDGSSTGGRITVAAGERSLFVDVDWLTGRVAINE